MRDLWYNTGPVLHPAGKHVAGLDVVGLRHGQEGVGGQWRTGDQVRLCWLLLVTENSTAQHCIVLTFSYLQVRVVDPNDRHTATIDRVVKDLPVISGQ